MRNFSEPSSVDLSDTTVVEIFKPLLQRTSYAQIAAVCPIFPAASAKPDADTCVLVYIVAFLPFKNDTGMTQSQSHPAAATASPMLPAISGESKGKMPAAAAAAASVFASGIAAPDALAAAMIAIRRPRQLSLSFGVMAGTKGRVSPATQARFSPGTRPRVVRMEATPFTISNAFRLANRMNATSRRFCSLNVRMCKR